MSKTDLMVETMKKYSEKPEARPDDICLPEQALMLQSVEALYNKIALLEHTVAQQRQQLQFIAVELLIRGLWKPMDILREQLDFRYDCCMLGCYDFVEKGEHSTAENPELVRVKQEVFRIFSECFQPQFPCYVCETDAGLSTVLLNVPNLSVSEHRLEESQLLAAGRRFLRRSAQELNITLNLSLGNCCMDMETLPAALQEVNSLRQLQDAIPWISELIYAGKPEQFIERPPSKQTEVEDMLTQAIDLQNISEIHRCVFFLATLEIQRGHSIEQSRNRLRRLVESIHDELNLGSAGLTPLMELQRTFTEIGQAYELFVAMAAYFNKIERIGAKKQQKGQAVLSAEAIKAYIDSHYTDLAMDLGYVAEALHASENTISKTFKRRYQTGALHYIQKVRLQAAIRLLEESDLTIPEIVLASGFSSRRTFDRVFRQHTGTTAAQYRKGR